MLTVASNGYRRGVEIRACQNRPEPARIYSAACRPVVETRFSFLLTAVAVTLSKRMQFHRSEEEREIEREGESNFSLTGEKYAALSRAFLNTGRWCCWKSASLTEGDCLIYVTHVLRAYTHVCWVYLEMSTPSRPLFFRFATWVWKDKYDMVSLNWKKIDRTRILFCYLFLYVFAWKHRMRTEQKE